MCQSGCADEGIRGMNVLAILLTWFLALNVVDQATTQAFISQVGLGGELNPIARCLMAQGMWALQSFKAVGCAGLVTLAIILHGMKPKTAVEAIWVANIIWAIVMLNNVLACLGGGIW